MFPDAPPAKLDWTQNPVELPTMPGSIEAMETSLANILKKLDSMEFKAISDDLRKAMSEIDQTLATLRGTLTNTDKLLGTADKVIAPDSALIGGLDDTLQQVGGAARSLRVLADYLDRHPEALIRGKTENAK
jgi:paraquat-inducible protein B